MKRSMKSVRAVDCFLNGYHANSCLVHLAFHINVKRCFGHVSQKCELKIICRSLRMCGLISAVVSSCRLHFQTAHLLMALAQQETTKLARLQSALRATTPATGKILKCCFKNLFLSLSLSLSSKNIIGCFFYNGKFIS